MTDKHLQVENGEYTRIVNAVLERLISIGLLGSEYQIVLFVIRKTWGYQKTDDCISLSQFEQSTGLSRPTVISALTNLVDNHILIKGSSTKSGTSYRFNKYWQQWGSKASFTSQTTSKAVFTRTSKHRFTGTSKAVLTHKRKKERKKGYESFLRSREQLISNKST